MVLRYGQQAQRALSFPAYATASLTSFGLVAASVQTLQTMLHGLTAAGRSSRPRRHTGHARAEQPHIRRAPTRSVETYATHRDLANLLLSQISHGACAYADTSHSYTQLHTNTAIARTQFTDTHMTRIANLGNTFLSNRLDFQCFAIGP